ncbi:MAG: hypothetical protein ACREXW_12405 [Gammaproteobacteria bacterium]
MVAVKLDDLSMAFEFVGAAPRCENNAYISLDTGEIFWTSELNPMDEDLPDDLETSDRYLAVPHKTDLDLGKRLALRFAAREVPGCYDQVAGFFRREDAYARFKALLDSKGALDRWHAYEAESIEQALRAWCAENGLELSESPRSSG